MIPEAIQHLVFYWLTPFGVAILSFLITQKITHSYWQKLDSDRIWHFFASTIIIIGLLLGIWVFLGSFGVWKWLGNYFSQFMAFLRNNPVWVTIYDGFIKYIVAIAKFIIRWLPPYIRAFVVVWVIATLMQIQSLIWRVNVTRGANIILSTALLFPFLILQYFSGAKTPVFDFYMGRLFVAKLKENLNDANFAAIRGVDDKGQPFKPGVGGSRTQSTVINATKAIQRTHAEVHTGKNAKGRVVRMARIIVPVGREVETNHLIETNLKSEGQLLVASNIRFPDNATMVAKADANKSGYVLESEVPFNAADNLGSFRAIFVNPFARENNGGRGWYKVFVDIVRAFISYMIHFTPPAIYDSLVRRAERKFVIDKSAQKAKYVAQQNLDLSVIPVPTDPTTGNDIATQRIIAQRRAEERADDVTNALNSNKIHGDLVNIKVGGNTAIYEYNLPKDANLPTDFNKVQESIGNMLRIHDVPIIKLAAGVLSLSMINGVNIPVDFRDMIHHRKKGMPGIISGMAGVDALGKDIYFELGDKNPHAMLFGKTGTGKTVTIMTILYSIMSAVTPDQLKIAYIDGKGNSFEFMRTDADAAESPEYHPNPFTYAQPADASGDIDYGRALIKHFERETRRRIELFKQKSVSKLADFNRKYPDEALPEILVVVDEFSAITSKDKDLKASEVAQKSTIDTFEYIAKMSRSVGIRMLLANQSARKELVPGKISANITGRLSLGVTEPIESEIALPESKISVHLISQPGEFYSIMNGIRNPEHGNSPYLTDDVMYALNDGLEKKFGHHDYVITREEVLAEMGEAGQAAKETKVQNDLLAPEEIPNPVPELNGKGDPIKEATKLAAIIERYPKWALLNQKSDLMIARVFNGEKPSMRRQIKSILREAFEKARAAEPDFEAKMTATQQFQDATTRRVAGAHVASRSSVREEVAQTAQGRDAGRM